MDTAEYKQTLKVDFINCAFAMKSASSVGVTVLGRILFIFKFETGNQIIGVVNTINFGMLQSALLLFIRV